MDKKLFNILIGTLLLVSCLLFFAPTTVIASDCRVILEKGEIIKPTADMDHISQFMYQDGKYAFYTFWLQLGTKRILLDDDKYVLSEWISGHISKSNDIRKIDINLDSISDYIIIISIQRSLDNCYVVDGKNHNLIFSSEWKNYDRRFDVRKFNFGKGWIVEKVIISDPSENDTWSTYKYFWSKQEGKFVSEKK